MEACRLAWSKSPSVLYIIVKYKKSKVSECAEHTWSTDICTSELRRDAESQKIRRTQERNEMLRRIKRSSENKKYIFMKLKPLERETLDSIKTMTSRMS